MEETTNKTERGYGALGNHRKSGSTEAGEKISRPYGKRRKLRSGVLSTKSVAITPDEESLSGTTSEEIEEVTEPAVIDPVVDADEITVVVDDEVNEANLSEDEEQSNEDEPDK